MADAAVATLPMNRSEAEPLAMVSVGPLLTVPFSASVPLLAMMVPVPVAIFAAIVPAPVSVPPLPMVMPEASVSVAEPPSSLMVPLVMLSAALMVSAPALPTSSVWLLLEMAIAAAAVAVLPMSRSEPATLAMVSVGPLATVPLRFSVPPLAMTVPAPTAMLAAMVPAPVKVPPVSMVRPEASVSVAELPSSLMMPLVMLSAWLMVSAPAVPISSV